MIVLRNLSRLTIHVSRVTGRPSEHPADYSGIITTSGCTTTGFPRNLRKGQRKKSPSFKAGKMCSSLGIDAGGDIAHRS
jgi:hypothetical protein